MVVRQTRLKLQLSLNQAGIKGGISYQMIDRVEKGERIPSVDTLLRIAHALRTTAWALLKEAEERAKSSSSA